MIWITHWARTSQQKPCLFEASLIIAVVSGKNTKRIVFWAAVPYTPLEIILGNCP